MKNEKILALRCALLIAVSEAEKKKDTEDDGTSNMDTPILFLQGGHGRKSPKHFN